MKKLKMIHSLLKKILSSIKNDIKIDNDKDE